MIQSRGKSAMWAAALFYMMAICLTPFVSFPGANAQSDVIEGPVIGIDLGTTYS